MSITVVPYNPEWPQIFKQEAALIEEALGLNLVAIHHVGSTAVPGLVAKPKIDILLVVKDPVVAIAQLEQIGIEYRGEYNIPLHYGFSKRGKNRLNIHCYESDHPEIELNLLFRNYLRAHPEARDEYSQLKAKLLADESHAEKKNSMFSEYTLGKDAFIHKILKLAQFDLLRMVRCTHYKEWETAKLWRQKYFFDPAGVTEPYSWAFDHPDHIHLMLYQGVEMIGYAHFQLWPDSRAALRIFVIDVPYRATGVGSKFLQLCEKWLKRLGIKSIHDEARPDTVSFYRKNGYSAMPFNDPSGAPPSPHDIAMGKALM